MSDERFHRDLPDGTILRNRNIGMRIKVERQQGTFAAVRPIRKDGERDKRWIGWSGSLCRHCWEIER